LNLLSTASNEAINIYNENIIRNMGAYIYRTHIGGNYYVDVADSHPEVYPEAVMVWRYGQKVNDTTLAGFGGWLYHNGSNNINSTFHRSRALYDMIDLKKIIAERSAYHQINQTWLPNVQMMTTRLQNGLFVAAHGGNNGESHNHNDVGDFIVYADNDPVIIDVGSGTYTAKTFSKDRYSLWFNTSAYHNLPTIDGQQQSEGSRYGAIASYKKDKGRIVFTMEIEKAYPAEANVKTWERTITADNNAIVIDDKFESSKPVTSLTQTFMTVCEADISKPGTIVFTTAHGRTVLLQYEKEWQATKETMALNSEDELGLKTTWRNQPISRILLTLKPATAKATFRFIVGMAAKN